MTTTTPAPDLWHYSVRPWTALCGADEANQGTTTDSDRVTCPDCFRMLVDRRAAGQLARLAREIRGPLGVALVDGAGI